MRTAWDDRQPRWPWAVGCGLSRLLAFALALGAPSAVSAAPGGSRPRPRSAQVVHPKLTKLVRAPYPEAARKAGRQGTVVMHVTVSEKGAVTAVKVVRSAGKDLDAAAVAAVRQFRYRPARVGGKAVAVKIVVAYPFRLRGKPHVAARPRPRPRPRPRLRPRPKPRPPARTAELSGRVKEKGTRKPLSDVELVVLASRKGQTGPGARIASVYTDDGGRFKLKLAPARYNVQVRAAGCFAFQVRETLAPGARVTVEYYVQRRVYDPYHTVVVAKAIRKEITRYSVALPVIEKIPGTQGDALRAIQNMPGVGRASFSLGFLIVRGAEPRDTRVLFEGFKIPMLYHFMGLSSVFNSDLLSRIDFMPGNFPVGYGRATGGVIDVFARRPKRDGWHGYLDADLWDIGALVEGPVGRGSLALSLRRAHVDAILALIPDIALTAAYYDYQALLDYPVGGGRLKVVAFGADDRLKRRIEQSSRFEQVHVTLFVKSIAVWSRRWGANRLRLGVAGGYTRTESGPGPDAIEDTGRVEWRMRYSRALGQGLTVAAGAVGEVARVRLSTGPGALSLDLLDNEDAEEGAPRATELWSTLVNQALFLEAAWKPRPWLTLVPGLRGDLCWTGSRTRLVLDPRLTATFTLLPNKLELVAAVGLFHQEPRIDRLQALLQGNPRLRHERALHAGIGLNWQIHDSVRLETTAFYKQLWGVIVESDALVLRGDGAASENLANRGRGRIWGGELLLKKTANADCPSWLKVEKCFGWLSYTLLRSERQAGPGAPWEVFEDDQTHLLTAVVSGTWPGGWVLGIRFRLASGRPELFNTGGLFDSDANTYLPAAGSTFPGRMPMFHQLDIRVDKRFVFKRWMLALYLDIQNVYSYQYSEFVQYNYNYTKRGTLQGLPILPSLGIKGEF